MSILTFIIVSVIKTALVLFVLLTAVAYTVWLERKVVGHMQNRWGPTRVGPFGLLQPAADGIRGQSWEVKLPTTLVWLDTQSTLPTNPGTTLDPPPGQPGV